MTDTKSDDGGDGKEETEQEEEEIDFNDPFQKVKFFFEYMSTNIEDVMSPPPSLLLLHTVRARYNDGLWTRTSYRYIECIAIARRSWQALYIM